MCLAQSLCGASLGVLDDCNFEELMFVALTFTYMKLIMWPTVGVYHTVTGGDAMHFDYGF
jgi:hypothetical protein